MDDEESRPLRMQQTPASRSRDQANRTINYSRRPPKTSVEVWNPEHLLRFRELIVGVTSGLIVAILTVLSQSFIDDRRENEADRRENLRFLREKSSIGDENRTFTGLDLREQNMNGLLLKGSDFESANLSDAHLVSTYLVSSNLNKVDFSDATILGAGFSGSLMQGVDMRKAHLVRADMFRADLSLANFRKVSMRDSFLNEADITYANFSRSSLENVDLRSADLSNADFSNSKLSRVNLSAANMQGADLGGVKFVDVCYTETTRWPEGFEPPPASTETCFSRAPTYFTGPLDRLPNRNIDPFPAGS